MNIASLLPGVRQLRAPLVAGLLTLVTAYLWLEKPLEDLWGDQDLAGLRNLRGLLGKAGALATLGFLAYLIGSLAVDVAMSVVRAISSVAIRRNNVDVDDSYLFRIVVSPTAQREAGRIVGGLEYRLLPMWRDGYAGVGRRISQIVGEGGESCLPNPYAAKLRTAEQLSGYEIANEDDVRRKAVEQFKTDVVQEIASGTVATRLLTSESFSQLREEYDRHSAEAELRIGLAVPFLALLMTICVELDTTPGIIAGATGLVLLIAVVWHSLTARRQAGDVLGLAIGDLHLSTPMIDLSLRQIELKGPQLSPMELDRARERSEAASLQLLTTCSELAKSVSANGMYFEDEIGGVANQIEALAVQLLDAEVRERFHLMAFALRHSSALAQYGGEFPRQVAARVESLARNAVTHVLSGEVLIDAGDLRNWHVLIDAYYSDLDEATRAHREEERRAREDDAT